MSTFSNLESDDNHAFHKFPIGYRDEIHEVNTRVATEWGGGVSCESLEVFKIDMIDVLTDWLRRAKMLRIPEKFHASWSLMRQKLTPTNERKSLQYILMLVYKMISQ